MVFYFKARPEAGDFTIFMGLDKYENEELIKYGFPEDIWYLFCFFWNSIFLFFSLYVVASRLLEYIELRCLKLLLAAFGGRGRVGRDMGEICQVVVSNEMMLFVDIRNSGFFVFLSHVLRLED